MKHTHKPLTDDAVKAMQERNARRVAIAKRVMGREYLLHPANRVQSIKGAKIIPHAPRILQMQAG